MRRAPRLITEVQRLGMTVSVAALIIVILVVFRVLFSAAVTAPADDRLQAGLLAVEDSHQSMLEMDSSQWPRIQTGSLSRRRRAGSAVEVLSEPARGDQLMLGKVTLVSYLMISDVEVVVVVAVTVTSVVLLLMLMSLICWWGLVEGFLLLSCSIIEIMYC